MGKHGWKGAAGSILLPLGVVYLIHEPEQRG